MSAAPKVDFSIVNLSEEKRGKIYHAVKECAGAMTRARGEREYVTETVKKIVTETEIPKKIFNKLVKTFFKQNFETEVADHEFFERLYLKVTTGTKS
jgi:predicted regulator of amino acid metabolism with ACT domain